MSDWFANPASVPFERIDAHAAEQPGLYRQVSKVLGQIDRWAMKNNINGTPAKFLNGRLLPPDVQLADLTYLLKQTT